MVRKLITFFSHYSDVRCEVLQEDSLNYSQCATNTDFLCVPTVYIWDASGKKEVLQHYSLWGDKDHVQPGLENHLLKKKDITMGGIVLVVSPEKSIINIIMISCPFQMYFESFWKRTHCRPEYKTWLKGFVIFIKLQFFRMYFSA